MAEQQTQEQQNAPQFSIQRIYVKDASFEAPNAPQIFQGEWEPNLKLDVDVINTTLEKDVYEVILSLTATVSCKEKIAFLAEIKQAGIFTISGTTNEQLDPLLGGYCPSILYPYAREAISSQVVRGSFPQLVLAPINFDAFYAQQLEKKKKADEKLQTEQQ